MHGVGVARRSVLVLARSVRGRGPTAAAVGPPTALRRLAEHSWLRGHGMASSGAGPVHTSIVRAVKEALAPVEIELVDDSASHAGHGGMKGREAVESHFKLRVVSDKFEGMPLVKRHQMVYGLLEKEFAAGLHALNITAKTPGEIAKAAAKKT